MDNLTFIVSPPLTPPEPLSVAERLAALRPACLQMIEGLNTLGREFEKLAAAMQAFACSPGVEALRKEFEASESGD